MNKLKIFTLTVFAILTAVLVVLRVMYLMDEPIVTKEFSIVGLTSGIGVECGEMVSGITVAVPDVLEQDDVISVSSDPSVAYLKLIKDQSEDRAYPAQIIAVSEGIAELYVRSADGEIVSEKYLVNVFCNGETAVTTDDTSVIEYDVAEEGEVYVTPKGSKYHLSRKCAGSSAAPVLLEKAVGDGYEPCKSCAVKE